MAIIAWRCLREDGRNSLTPRMVGAAVVLLAMNAAVVSECVAGVLPDEFLEMLLMLESLPPGCGDCCGKRNSNGLSRTVPKLNRSWFRRASHYSQRTKEESNGGENLDQQAVFGLVGPSRCSG